MSPQNPGNAELSRQISIPNKDGAKALAARLPPPEVGETLKAMADNPKASVRMLVLELATEHPSENASRVILSRLQDANLTVRAIAGGQISRIGEKSLVPEMFKAMDQDLASSVKGALAKQIGLVGDAGDLPRLRRLWRTTDDSAFRHDLELAMVRLGDDHSREELVHRLTAPPAETRLEALRDVPYVGDKRLAMHFGPLLEDRRDVSPISLPHDPVVAGRVCDFAIQALAALGMKFSFPTVPIRRFTEAEILQAQQMVAAIQNMA
jgi:HEAT repeat protein